MFVTLCTWSVQKVSRILNSRALRIFDFQVFCSVMLVFISYNILIPTSSTILNVQLIFDRYFAWTSFGSSLIFSISKMDQRICNKLRVINKIKCVDAFRMLTVTYGKAILNQSNVYRWYKMFSEG